MNPTTNISATGLEMSAQYKSALPAAPLDSASNTPEGLAPPSAAGLATAPLVDFAQSGMRTAKFPRASLAQKGDSYLLRLPFELKDSFRELFKTATWNPVDKAFVVKATPANERKWQAFLQRASEFEVALAAKEYAEATAEELSATYRRIQESRDSLSRERDAALKRAEEMRTSIEEIRSSIENLGPLREAAMHREAEVSAEAVKTMNEFLDVVRPAIAVFDRHTMNEVLRGTLAAARKGYSGKDRLSELHNKMCKARRDLQSVGYCHPLLDELCNYSLNRADKFERTTPLLQSTLLTGLKPFVNE